MLWLSLNFYQLPLDVFSLETPEGNHLECQFAVTEKGMLVYCNQRALDAGIESGMKIPTAYALSSELKIKQRCYELEESMLIQLATVAYEFSSQVCLYNQQTILLEIEASFKLFASLISLLEKLSARLSNNKINFFAALAATPKAAYLLSVYEKKTIDKLLQFAKFETLMSIVQQSKKNLAEIPVAYLNYESTVLVNVNIEKIRKMGIKRLGELIHLPYSAVGRRFGKVFLHYLYRLKGDIKDPLCLFSIPEKFSIQRCFVDGLDTVEQVLFPARPMIEELSMFLKIRRVMAAKIIWRFICFNGDELFFEISLSSEVQNSEQLMELTRLKLQDFILKDKVEVVTLESDKLVVLSERQSVFVLPDSTSELNFESAQCNLEASMCLENVSSLIDKLKVRLGEERCLVLSLSDKHLPEEASSVARISDIRIKKTEINSQEYEPPVWLLEKTIMVRNNQAQLFYRGPLSLLSSPERIENNWWLNNQRRDYYLAEGNKGIRYWIYRDMNTNQWLLHGVF